MGLTKVASKNDIQPGQTKVVEANGKKIALFNVEGTIHATNNECAHQGGPLGEGSLDGKVVTCPWHGWQFDVTTGSSPVNDQAKIGCFKVEVQGEDILVDV